MREKAGSRFLFVELLEGTSAAESTLTSHGTAFSWVEQATPFVGKPEVTRAATRTEFCQLALNRLSDNVGGVKQLLSIPIRALGEERHFALVEMAVPTTGSLVIVFQVQTLGPTHASLRSLTAIMITTSNSSS